MARVKYAYHDVVREPRALYEMISRVKPIVGSKTPNPERGQNSMSPSLSGG